MEYHKARWRDDKKINFISICGLQTSARTRNTNEAMTETERLLTVWIEDCNQKPLAEQPFSLLKRMKEKKQ
jgi:hypothetical protein